MRVKNRKENNPLKRLIIVLIILALTAFILIKAQNYLKEQNVGKINLIINNNNVTERLKWNV